MMLKKPATALIAFSALLVNAMPVAATTISVSSNGANSTNIANVSVAKTIDISQTNTASVNNNVTAAANTGDNTANKNTGGDIKITTGDAGATVSGSTSANSNKMSLACCTDPGANVSVSNNGTDSKNKVTLKFANTSAVETNNNLDINNNFNITTNTGGNKADKNTGGDVIIKTGDANALVKINNKGNENVLLIGMLTSQTPTPTPTPNPIPNTPGLPKAPAVLGVTKLPMTGFDYPVKLILLASLSLVGLGIALNKKASSVKQSLDVA